MYQYKTLSNGIKVVAEKIDYLKSISIGVWVGNGSRYENKEVNGIIPESFDMMIGNIIDDKEVQEQVGYEKYDIVTANILADVLVPLTPVIVAQMKKGAYYITSGILDVKEDVVVKAVKDAGLTLVEVTHQGEWVSVTARKD